MKPLVTILEKSQFIGSLSEPAIHRHSRPLSHQSMIYFNISKLRKNPSAMAVTAAPMVVQKFISIRSQGLGPTRRPLTASLDSNIRKVLKEGIKPKYGETPTSWSLRKLPKFGTYAKPSLRRAVLLLVPKIADGRIVCISREKFDHCKSPIFFPTFFPF